MFFLLLTPCAAKLSFLLHCTRSSADISWREAEPVRSAAWALMCTMHFQHWSWGLCKCSVPCPVPFLTSSMGHTAAQRERETISQMEETRRPGGHKVTVLLSLHAAFSSWWAHTTHQHSITWSPTYHPLPDSPFPTLPCCCCLDPWLY